MYYLKEFDTHSEYETYMGGEPLLPNVSICNNQNDVHFTPYDPFNGHEYVDLGLPSGTLWATMNVGAETETDYGLYFSWGGTTGYADASTKNFAWADYELGNGGNTTADMTKYNETDGKTVLEPEDDAAHVFMGGSWRMPTKTEILELLRITYVIPQWQTNYKDSGIKGILLTSRSNGNTLFLPAGSYYNGESGSGETNKSAIVWSSTLNASNILKANCGFGMYNNGTGGNQYNRNYGIPVRGVIGQ